MQTTSGEQDTIEKETKVTKKYDQDDEILCRSVTQGELIVPCKSGVVYRFSNIGDTEYITYSDLYALKSKRSEYLYSPLFVIEETEMLTDNKWKDLQTLYDSLYKAGDIEEVLKLKDAQFKKVLEDSPIGFKKAIAIEVTTRFENKTFDSLNKIRIVEEICGVDLLSNI